MLLKDADCRMCRPILVIISALCVCLLSPTGSRAEDLAKQVRKAVEKSTLDQPGTRPFHIKATFTPSFERDKSSNRVGEIEIWWDSPTVWRREVRSPEFHQIAIQNGVRQWQKNDGDYFPEWLRELATAIIQPVPLPDSALEKRVKAAEVRRSIGQTNVDWEESTGFADQQENGKGYVALSDKTGLLLYAGGPGFGGLYHDFKDFHGRMIATTVASGYVEVTAKVNVLEDLGSVPSDFFSVDAPGGDAQPIETVVLSEAELRANLLPGKPFVWPALKDGPLDGIVWTEIVIDRSGRIREMIPPVADNPGVQEAAAAGFGSMQFRPVLRNGIPVQVTGRLSVPFKTVRPVGDETFDSARNYFEHGRKVSFLAAGSKVPYTLRAEFQVGTQNGVQTGSYEDTWMNATEWRREAWYHSSHLVKTESGDVHYVLAEGPEAGLLRLVMQLLEPIPAADTMTESDWRIERDTRNRGRTIRVFRGPEGPNGEPEPGKSQGYWFDDSGGLVESYTSGFDVRFAQPGDYNGVQVARRIDVLQNGKIGMRILIQEIGPASPKSDKEFKLKGHEWQRAFTSEVR